MIWTEQFLNADAAKTDDRKVRMTVRTCFFGVYHYLKILYSYVCIICKLPSYKRSMSIHVLVQDYKFRRKN